MRIRDNGPGIPAHMLGEIFEMFRQGDDSLERANGGLGIRPDSGQTPGRGARRNDPAT